MAPAKEELPVNKEDQLSVSKERMPAWVQQFRLKFSASVAHTFLVTGNVRDVINNRMTVDAYLSKMFLSPAPDGVQYFDIVVFYDRATGIHFPLEGMKEAFMKEAGMAALKPEATAGVFAAKATSSSKAMPSDPTTAFNLIESVLRSERKNSDGKRLHTAVIIDHAQTIVPAGQMATLTTEDRFCLVKILDWARDPKLSDAANPIILIADSAAQLNEAITASASRIESLEVLLPSPEERKSFIDFLETQEREKQREQKKPVTGLSFVKGFDAQQFAHLSAGLRKLNLEDIKLSASKRGLPISPDLVKARKTEIYKSEYQRQLEVIDPERGFEIVGGMQWLKDYLKFDVIEPMISGDTARVPQGILFTGPPGTGKTILAMALAYEAHINMLRLNFGKLLGSLVGQSEHNMARALMAIRSLVPVLVFMDELDQSISRGATGDSGVSNRLFQSLLEFMSDTELRGKVVFVGATNRPDMMDAALKRRGRFDKIIPFLPPDTEQRADIFPSVIRRYGYKVDGKLDFEELATESPDWVGSDIEAAVVKAYQLARRDKRDSIKQSDLELALKKILPARQDVEHWTNLALLECSDVDLLPPSHRDEFMKRRKEIEVKVRKGNRESLEPSERTERDIL